eukprot:SAG31_NODE_1391_length_8535_cov_11.998696_10_plen_88_part_00
MRSLAADLPAHAEQQPSGPLASEQLAFYDRWGFLVLKQVYSSDEMDTIRHAAESQHHPGQLLVETEALNRLVLQDERCIRLLQQVLG